ncbi:MAG: hypothetical protein A2Y14_03290 [Verrucomicrobia bacterium GWF2_51_19]|nr:MAG: hypothetical protein A2Y14_03290 [Verrucomicrobia bacterium GWF2_51_19]HCJ11754.1 chemotaxis protein CheR [Opitutae bacterium]
MTLPLEDSKPLREFISKACAIQLGEEKVYLLKNRLSKVCQEFGIRDLNEFYKKVTEDKSGKLRDRLIDAITTNETLWFRDERLWNAIKENILPEIAKRAAEKGREKIRIWSAACSTGQEPYSLSMLIDSYCRLIPGVHVNPNNFEILATDISQGILAAAQLGEYNNLEMSRGLPPAFKKRYFAPYNTVWRIVPDIRTRVQFKHFNLQDPFANLGRFDLILCRNVAIYFSEEFKRNLFDRMSKSLQDQGVLILGSSESILGYSDKFDMKEACNAIYYRLKG